MSSLPVPVSPRISTVDDVGATVSTCARTAFSAGDSPTISSKSYSAPHLVLEVDLLERELVAQRRDLLERERVLDRERDLTGRCRENRHVVVAERLAPQAADDDRADAAPARAHRQEARRLDPELGENRPVAGPRQSR